jgi:ATP synthase F1 delta subunit
MFHAQRWADVFVSVCGTDANEAFLCLKALSEQLKTVHGVFFGHNASAKLEKTLRESAEVVPKVTSDKTASAKTALAKTALAVEYAIRFLCLLVEKKCFKYIALVLQRIEQNLNQQNGILDVTVESAAPVDGDFKEEMARMIKEKTGAAGIKMKTRLRPELLGGYLLRIGSLYIDASLKGQLDNMAAHLRESTGGSNGQLR